MNKGLRDPQEAQGSSAPLRVRFIQDVRSSSFAEKLSSVLNKAINHNWKWPVQLEGFGPDMTGTLSNLISRASETSDAVILISDRVAAESREHSAKRAGLAWELREQALTHQAVIYIVAVSQQDVDIPHLVDNTVREDADEAEICQRLVKAFRSIIYRCPPARSHREKTTAVQVRMVDGLDEFKASLRLRHRIYKLLGYGHDTVSEADGVFDLDQYDATALHFVATVSSGGATTVVGTARLVCCSSAPLRGSVFGNATSLPEWSGAVAELVAASKGVAAGLPVFETFDIANLPDSFNISRARLGEVGRVVVAEKFRGLGISRLLVRICIAAASDLGLSHLLLDCIPQHMPLYRKCGFEHVSPAGPHEDLRVGQFATLMHLDLDKDIADEPMLLAGRDVATMQSSRTDSMPLGGLCLCAHADCWRSGIYARRGASDCPLKEKFESPRLKG